jgi:general stress protein CsbA
VPVLGEIQQYHGEESKVFAVRISSFLDFAHYLVYKMNTTFQKPDLFNLKVKEWGGSTMLGLTERAFLITVKMVGLSVGYLYVHLGSVFICRRE